MTAPERAKRAVGPVDHEMVAPPERGRIFRASRRVRLGDVGPSGRLRLDALARYLQDVGNDDTADRGVGPGGAWVARRIALAVEGPLPEYLDDVAIATFPGGYSRVVVERRTDIAHARGVIRTATVWVSLDHDTMRPAPVPDWFHDLYGDVTPERRVSHRLRLPAPGGPVERRAWPLRATDYDVLSHVNNAIAWAAVEDELARRVRRAVPRRAAVEYPGAIGVGSEVELRSQVGDGALALWLVVAGDVRVAAKVELD